MKKPLLILFLLFGLVSKSHSQARFSSIDELVKTLYTAISGPAGAVRDSALIRSVFLPEARLMPVVRNKEGKVITRINSVDQYLKGLAKFTASEGFFEIELHREIQQYGNIAHVFSSYASFKKQDDKVPFQRGINSLQLMFDGNRWWVMNITWDAETPENPLPKKYLKN